jgi:hypothetical protein
MNQRMSAPEYMASYIEYLTQRIDDVVSGNTHITPLNKVHVIELSGDYNCEKESIARLFSMIFGDHFMFVDNSSYDVVAFKKARIVMIDIKRSNLMVKQSVDFIRMMRANDHTTGSEKEWIAVSSGPYHCNNLLEQSGSIRLTVDNNSDLLEEINKIKIKNIHDFTKNPKFMEDVTLGCALQDTFTSNFNKMVRADTLSKFYEMSGQAEYQPVTYDRHLIDMIKQYDDDRCNWNEENTYHCFISWLHKNCIQEMVTRKDFTKYYSLCYAHYYSQGEKYTIDGKQFLVN